MVSGYHAKLGAARVTLSECNKLDVTLRLCVGLSRMSSFLMIHLGDVI